MYIIRRIIGIIYPIYPIPITTFPLPIIIYPTATIGAIASNPNEEKFFRKHSIDITINPNNNE
jgi:hypothetical protein